MDLFNLSLAGLAAIGVVNVVTFFKPELKSEVKFAISFLVAFGVAFIPAEFQNIILTQAKIALEVAFAASGFYKIAQVVGTKK